MSLKLIPDDLLILLMVEFFVYLLILWLNLLHQILKFTLHDQIYKSLMVPTQLVLLLKCFPTAGLDHSRNMTVSSFSALRMPGNELRLVQKCGRKGLLYIKW